MDREDSDWIFILSVYATLTFLALVTGCAMLDAATGWLS
jgi:hypothetical protein